MSKRCGMQENEEKLLHFACRHHISELILAHLFSLHDVSKSPNIEICPRFKEYWPQIDQERYCTALEDESLASVIAPLKDSVIASAISQLKEFKFRDDYRELLELTIIFFGGIPLRGTHFHYPGAVGYIVLAGWREPFFHNDGAVSKPVQCSEAAGSVPKSISLLWANSLEPLASVGLYLLLVCM